MKTNLRGDGQGPIDEPAWTSLTMTSDDKSYSQECDDLEGEACESCGATAIPYLVIAVLAALAGIAFWLLS